MVIRDMLKSIAENVCYVIAALIVICLQRWLLGLSTPEKDRKWIEQTKLGSTFLRLKWYRGLEFFHQMRAKRILAYAERTA